MLAEKEKQEIEKEINEQKLKVLQEEEDARRKLETEEQEEKRKRIKEALNTQTFAQFKVYAEQQYLLIFVIHSYDFGLFFFFLIDDFVLIILFLFICKGFLKIQSNRYLVFIFIDYH